MEKKLPAWYRKFLAEIGSKGGKRSLKTLTPEERKARAKKAAAASSKVRMKKAKARKLRGD